MQDFGKWMAQPVVQASAGAGAPSTVSQLREWFASKFDCEQGVPRAWFELPQEDGNVKRIVYVPFGIGGKNATEAQLVQALLEQLKCLQPLFGRKLFWRRDIALSHEQLTQFTGGGIPAEVVEDSKDFYAKHMPADWALDFDSNRWRKRTSEDALFGRLSLRIGIDGLTEEVGGYRDGEPFPLIGEASEAYQLRVHPTRSMSPMTAAIPDHLVPILRDWPVGTWNSDQNANVGNLNPGH